MQPIFASFCDRGHRWVRALRHKHIERGDAAFHQKFVGERKELVRVIVARLVRDDGEDALTGWITSSDCSTALDRLQDFQD